MFGYFLHFFFIFLLIFYSNFVIINFPFINYTERVFSIKINLNYNYHFCFSFIFTITTIIVWLIGIILLCSDFSIIFVAELSSINQPVFYKLSAFWSNNEGSLLLWYILQVGAYFVFINYIINKSLVLLKTYLFNNIYFTLLFLSFSSLLLSLLLLNFNFFLEFNVLEGKELNFILQDINITIHPPLIYASYVCYSIIFSVCLVILISKHRFYVIYVVRFLNLLSWFILTFSILLGSRWAYTELGWGGFWFWDPVEIISLLPWLLGLAFIHNLLINLRFRTIYLETLIFGICIYLFVILGTMLVRSGLLQSVHSFVISPNLFGILIFFFGLFIIIFLITLFKKYRYFIQVTQFSNRFNFVYYMYLILILYFFYLILILFFPILSKHYMNDIILFSYDFFNEIIVIFLGPFIIVFLIFSLKSQKLIFFFFGIIIFFICEPIFHFGFLLNYHFFLYLSICSLILLIISRFSFIIYHMGFFFAIFSLLLIIIYSEEFVVNFLVGDSLLINDNFIIFRDLNQLWTSNYLSTYANFLVINHNTDTILYDNINNTLFSEKRFYFYQSLINSKSIIYSNIFQDFYILLGDGNFENGWYVRILSIPFISWFWFGSIIIMFGTIFSLLRCSFNIK
nr:cytochrome C-type biogenesis protein CCMF [Cyanidioschyzonaceae sp. 1 FvB-2021]